MLIQTEGGVLQGESCHLLNNTDSRLDTDSMGDTETAAGENDNIHVPDNSIQENVTGPELTDSMEYHTDKHETVERTCFAGNNTAQTDKTIFTT